MTLVLPQKTSGTARVSLEIGSRPGKAPQGLSLQPTVRFIQEFVNLASDLSGTPCLIETISIIVIYHNRYVIDITIIKL